MDTTGSFSSFDAMNLPYSMDAEQAVLGCVLIEPSSMSEIQLSLEAEHFYMPQHQAIFRAMVELNFEKDNVDPLLVLEKLKVANVYDEAGGRTYLYQIAQMVPSTANLKSYINIVKEKFFLRRLITISRQIIDSAAHEDVDVKTLLNDAEQKIYEIAQGKTGNEPSKLSDIVVDKVLGRIENLQQDITGELKPISTGFSELDAVLGGLNKSDLILIGARPGMGKTSFALSLARNVAINGHKVLFFSMEMTKEQLAQRVISTETRISSEKLRDGRISTEEWLLLAKAASRLNDCLLYFDDNSNITVADMKATARRLREVRCVFVDYLGLVRPGSRRENRVQEVSEITRNLKLMAKELNIPVVCCAQLSRGTEGRSLKSHRPQLSDLRESGSIEQDADSVLMLYRENYYGSNDAAYDDEDEDAYMPEAVSDAPRADEVEVIVAKNRHGITKTIKFLWESEYTRYYTLERNFHDDP